MARPQGHRLSPPAFEDCLKLTGQNITRVAEVSGVPRSTISALHGGHHKASVPTAKAISDALGVNASTLFPTLHPNFTFVDGVAAKVEAVA